MAERIEELGGAVLQGEMPKSAVYIPLIVAGEAIGGSRSRTSTASVRSARATCVC